MNFTLLLYTPDIEMANEESSNPPF